MVASQVVWQVILDLEYSCCAFERVTGMQDAKVQRARVKKLVILGMRPNSVRNPNLKALFYCTLRIIMLNKYANRLKGSREDKVESFVNLS